MKTSWLGALSGAALILTVCSAPAAHAQDPSSVSAPAPVTVFGAERHALASTHVDQTFGIDVLPVISLLSPPAPGEKIPVVFVLDGDAYFPMVASMANLMSLDTLPSMLLVGIGYDFDPATPFGLRMLEVQARRNRDYTPTFDEAFLQQMRDAIAQFGATYPEHGRPGGADAFLAFINEELKPFIAERYPVADVEDNAIVGHSFGGLFALHALFTAPESFDRYVAGSPSPWWGGGALFASEESAGDLDVRVFMSMGALEPEEQMLGPVRQMDGVLGDGSRPSLEYTFHVFEGETHSSVVPATFSRGLREVFRAAP